MVEKRGDRLREAAESIAVSALAFIASDADRIGRFLALSGLEGTDIRAAAARPGFLAAVLGHVMADETLAAAFAAEQNLGPDALARAAAALGARAWERDTP